jgi:hypothetical protein
VLDGKKLIFFSRLRRRRQGKCGKSKSSEIFFWRRTIAPLAVREGGASAAARRISRDRRKRRRIFFIIFFFVLAGKNVLAQTKRIAVRPAKKKKI